MSKKKDEITKPDISVPDFDDLAAEKPAKKREATIPETHVKALPAVDLRVFLAICGKKPDQMAGFKAHVRINKLKAMPIADWHKAYADYCNKPV